ncbi:hypothetical protein A2U01_0097835, partial [Trifolium medium]|nr:hypothetical protein [Trifolium medium]
MARCAPMLRKLGLLLCQLRAAQDRMARRANQEKESIGASVDCTPRRRGW